ncbi:MAG: hypothetical protein IKJ01_06590 [Lachnospiraceae bacterium]|nr:hypothetical protein [Lachnospiraceae bacterium]
MNHHKTTAEIPNVNDDYLFAASNRDCTGLIPSGIQGNDEVDNYEEIYPYLPGYFPRPENIPTMNESKNPLK